MTGSGLSVLLMKTSASARESELSVDESFGSLGSSVEVDTVAVFSIGPDTSEAIATEISTTALAPAASGSSSRSQVTSWPTAEQDQSPVTEVKPV